MRCLTRFLCISVALIAFSISPASAQFRIELGGSTKSIERALENAGFTEIQITKSGLTTVRAQACYEGGRYIVKIKRLTGEIKRGSKIGECRRVLPPDAVASMLRDRGFRQISIDDSSSEFYIAIACREDRRFRMQITPYGDIVYEKRLGRCGGRLNFVQLKAKLRQNGYNRFQLVRQNYNRFVLEACRNDRRLRLRVRPNGVILRERRIGDCTPPIRPRDIPGILETKGFDRIKVVDNQLPVYIAEGCRRLDLVQIRLNRFGDVRKEEKVGDCDPPLSEAEVAKLLRDSGANRIDIKVDRNGNFVTTSCYKLRKFQTVFDKYGTVGDRKRIGRCPRPPHIDDILIDFKDRELSDLQLFVEGCRNGRRIRFAIE